MVNVRRQRQTYNPTGNFPGFQLRLTPSLLRILLGGVVILHVIVLWRATAGAERNVHDGNHHPNAKTTTIPFVVSMTNCGEDPFMEGAAVLKYSIHLASIHGNLGGRYDYKMFVIFDPAAKECVQSLAELGYELVERPTPVQVEEIQGDYLRSRIELNGCCGAKELIKLEALTFTQYPIVVHLDLDVILLQPLDPLFDVMLLDTSNDVHKNISSDYKESLHVMWPNQTLPNKVNAFLTRDFGMIHYGRKIKPVQGGFLVLRPDMNVYQDFVDIVKKGDFDEKSGWGKATGLFYGSMTIQGLMPYYFDVLHPGQAVDLNRCIYNQMADAPRAVNKKDPSIPGKCKTGEEECEDCRDRNVEDIVSMHFTICLKPWHCVGHHQEGPEHAMCRKMHHEWFRIRSSLEEAWGRSANGTGDWFREQFYGFCTRHGKKGYIPISRPFLPSF